MIDNYYRYFVWNEQIGDIAMGSPLSPIVTNFFMENCELRTAPYKLKY